MTLCIAWRNDDGNVCLASDSRVTVASNSFEDVAVKITRIPCEVFPPSSSFEPGTGIAKISLGMAFSGSHICAYVIKESLVEVLSRLQHVPGATEISMDKICKIAFYAYEKLSKKVCSTSIAQKGICELFLSGFCHKQKHTRAFRFSTDPINNTHSVSEILIPGGNKIELSGSGKSAPSLQAKVPSNPLLALKEVIDDPERPDVGGSFQFGITSENDFRIFSEYMIDKDGWPAYMRAGLNINGIIGESGYDDLFAAPIFCDIRP